VGNSTTICVLGSYRSGTSLTTRILNLLGVRLGSEDLLRRPASDNPKGFWEHEQIKELNDQILSRLGGNKFNPPTFPPRWEESPEFETLNRQARSVIKREFDASTVWGWKDPATCLTLPFWKRLLPTMRYVICLRNPLDVARSLQQWGFTFIEGMRLCLFYMHSALQNTAGEQRRAVFYEDLLERWQDDLHRISLFIGLSERVEQVQVRGAVGNFIDKRLQHHCTSLNSPSDDDGYGLPESILRDIQQVYLGLREDGDLQESGIDNSLQRLLRIVEQTARAKWTDRIELSLGQLQEHVLPGRSFILVDDNQWGTGNVVSGRHVVPFLERDGQYWGPPPDDATAIQELERLMQSGSTFMAFAWPAFWWLDYYQELRRYMESNFKCVINNDRIIAFELRP